MTAGRQTHVPFSVHDLDRGPFGGSFPGSGDVSVALLRSSCNRWCVGDCLAVTFVVSDRLAPAL